MDKELKGINKAINQKKFKNEHHKFIISIIYISNLIKNNHQKFLKNYNITEQQYNILRILRGSYPKPCSIGILKDRMLDKMSDASRLVDRLVNLKLVLKTENESDRRTADVFITDLGLKILSEIDKHEKYFSKVVSCISEKEAMLINQLFDKIIDSNNE